MTATQDRQVDDELKMIVDVPTLGDLLYRQAVRNPDKEAVVFPGQRLTYRELFDGVERRARSLLALGVRPGDHVGIMLPPSLPLLHCMFACATIGAVAVLINTRYRASELAYVVENADIRLLVTSGRVSDELDYAERLFEALPELAGAADPRSLDIASAPRFKTAVLIGDAPRAGFVSEDEFDRAADDVSARAVHELRVGVGLRDCALIIYTSGTTSAPKGCLLSHEAVVRGAQSFAIRLGFAHDTRAWCALPMFHLGGLGTLAAAWASGGTYISPGHFDAGSMLRMFEEERISFAQLPLAAFINEVVAHPDLATRDLSHLRSVLCNPVMQSPDTQAKLDQALPGVVQISSYGMTEGAGACCSTGAADAFNAGKLSNGRPLPGVEIRVTDEEGRPAAAGELGEIWFRGPVVFDGYYRDAEKTSEVLRDGWVRSGDRGRITEAGELCFVSRLKDMLKVGGENVAAVEIEGLVEKHPSVRMCQVIGVPDYRLTEVAAAFVELHEDSTTTEVEIIDFCRDRIASFKVPRYVRFVRCWPLTISGKIQKHELTAIFASEAETA